MKPDVAANLKKIREEKGFTKEQVAEHLGYSVSGYRKIEQGQRSLSMANALEIAKFLNCSLDEIFLVS